MAEKVKGCKLLEENTFFFKISMNKVEIMSRYITVAFSKRNCNFYNFVGK